MDLCEFEASLVYKVSSRTAKTTQRNPFLKIQNGVVICSFYCELCVCFYVGMCTLVGVYPWRSQVWGSLELKVQVALVTQQCPLSQLDLDNQALLLAGSGDARL